MGRLLVCGSRTWDDQGALRISLDNIVDWWFPIEPVIVVHGACPMGADALADEWARARGHEVERHPAQWELGKSAGPKRNREMASLGARMCVAFMHGASRGTRNMIAYAVQYRIPTFIVHPPSGG